MTCRDCEALARKLSEALEELEEWRAQERRDVLLALDMDRVARVKRWLTIEPAPARVLMTLLDHAPRPVRHHTLVLAASPDPSGNTIEHVTNVYVCRLRKALAREGLRGAVTTHHSYGYSIARDFAQRIEAMIAERAGV